MLKETELEYICGFIMGVNNGEPLNGDDIEQIKKVLQVFNGDTSENDELSVKVFFQDRTGISSSLVATFDDEEMYDNCFPSLKVIANRNNMDITESINEDR